MKATPSLILLGLAGIWPAACGEPVHRWPLDTAEPPGLVLHGKAEAAGGVENQCLVLDGQSALEATDSPGLTHGEAGFTLVLWFNPFAPGDGQQMLAAKNRYSLNEREWGLMIDQDGKIRLYVWQGGWKTIAHEIPPEPGHWYQVGIVMRAGEAGLWVDGALSGTLPLTKPPPRTKAPLTLGGSNDNGRIWQTLFGALDDVQVFNRPLSTEDMAARYHPVTATLPAPERPTVTGPRSDPSWDETARANATEDRTALIFDGKSPDQLACDTTLRKMPDDSWVTVMLGGGDREPMPRNRVFLSRSQDEGQTWSPMEPVDLGVKAKNPDTALVPSELMVHGGRCTLFVATHDGKFGDWKEWMTHSDDSCRSWSTLEPAPGRLQDRTFIRNHIITRDGRILLPFQHYLDGPGPLNPRNGVLMSEDGGKTWAGHGDIRLTDDDNYRGWAENNIAELADGRIVMIIRADRLGGVLYQAESTDGGRTWPDFATKTDIPNPGSKATLYPLGGNAVALLHNPNPRGRFPLSLWVSFDGLKTWPYQRVLVAESSKGPGKALNYPDGFVSPDKRWLHFAFDDARYRAVYVGARLPGETP